MINQDATRDRNVGPFQSPVGPVADREFNRQQSLAMTWPSILVGETTGSEPFERAASAT